MRKLNLGCGGNLLAGWENHDMDWNIEERLPCEDNSIDFIFAEHVCEHLDSPSALRFFDECYRILKSGGVVRIAVPSVSQISLRVDQEYLDWLGRSGFGEPNPRSALRNIVLNHGHKSCWSHEILGSLLYASGFEHQVNCSVGYSPYPELCGVEGHGMVIGDHNNEIETIVMEAVK